MQNYGMRFHLMVKVRKGPSLPVWKGLYLLIVDRGT